MQKDKIIKLIGLLLLCSILSTSCIWEKTDVYEIIECNSSWVPENDNSNRQISLLICGANKFSNDGNETRIVLASRSIGLFNIGDKIKIIKK